MNTSRKTETRPFVSITTDYGIHSEGVGIIKGTVLSICPEANVVDLTHGVVSFDVVDGAREFETIAYLPKGIHVCVVDPNVGTDRKCLIVETFRGDLLVGPDNGVLLPAARKIGGIGRVIEIEESDYVKISSSRTFAGRDVFAVVAGWLACGMEVDEFGKEIPLSALSSPAFNEAILIDGWISAEVIHVNKFGSAILNLEERWLSGLGVVEGVISKVMLPGERCIEVLRGRSFPAVAAGEPVLVPDDYGRMELAINLGSLVDKCKLGLHDGVKIQPPG